MGREEPAASANARAETRQDVPQMDAPRELRGQVAIAAATTELGLADQAETVAAVRALEPGYGRRLMASLAKAGLPRVAPSSGS